MADASQTLKPFLLNSEPTNQKAEDAAEIRREEQREQLVLELVVHAHILASAQIRQIASRLTCIECGQDQRPGERGEHAGTCRVGRVLSVIRELALLVGQGIEPAPAADRGLHYFEPWKADGDRLEVNGEGFYIQTADESLRLEDLLPGSTRRIAAAINFAEGVEMDVLEDKPLVAYRAAVAGGAA